MNLHFIFPLLLQKIIWIPTRLVLTIFGRLKVYGLENLHGLPRPVIFACNHSSEIDPFMVPASLPFLSSYSPLFYATKEKSFYSANGWRKHLFGGFFINMWGGHTAQTGLRDYQKSLSTHVNIILHGGSFCVFPEGGITRDGNIQPARGGISYLAERSGCQIIPVSISGVYGISLKEFFWGGLVGRVRVTMNFGKAISQEELKRAVPPSTQIGDNAYKKKADYVMEKVKEGMINGGRVRNVMVS